MANHKWVLVKRGTVKPLTVGQVCVRFGGTDLKAAPEISKTVIIFPTRKTVFDYLNLLAQVKVWSPRLLARKAPEYEIKPALVMVMGQVME